MDSQDRTATVEAPEDKEAEVVEIDWGITEQDHELLDRLLGLGQNVERSPWTLFRLQKKVGELETENKKLKSMNIALKKKLNL